MKLYRLKILIIILILIININGSVAIYLNESPLGSSYDRHELRGPLESYFSDNGLKKGMINAIPTETLNKSWKTKCSFQLLQLLDGAYIPQGITIDSIKSQLIAQQLYLPANQTSQRGFCPEKDLVFIEILLDPSENIQNITPYLFETVEHNDEFGIIIAYVPVENLQTIASFDEVDSIRFVIPPVLNVGSVNSEGDYILHSSEVRLTTPFRGNGIKVGVISDSVDHLAESQARGDLPNNVHVLRNDYSFTHADEGIALLEIIHDIAPGAELYFHDTGGTSIGFITAIDALSNAGCNIICDDLSFFDQPFFEDGSTSNRINEILSTKDILFISAAGNLADKHYQGLFYNSGDGTHDFSRGGFLNYKDLYFTLEPGDSARVFLQWNDKWGESTNNYALGLYDLNTKEYLAISYDIQNNIDIPMEFCYYKNEGSSPQHIGIMVEKNDYSEIKVLEIFVVPSGDGFHVYFDNIIPSDSIFEHAAVSDVITVGAIDSQDPGNDNIEPFSSQGPVTIYYPSSELRKKPDICGIDNVSITGVGGFMNPFMGTSAAAPHIAGIAALVWSANPSLSGNQIRAALFSSADDLSWPGWDSIFGYGRANAQKMFVLMNPETPTPTPTTQTPTPTPTTPTPTPTTTSPTPTTTTTQTTSLLAPDFTVAHTSGVAPLTVHFQDTSMGNPTGWIWDINGDGFQDYSEKSFEHTFTSPGIYSVTFTVTRNHELATISRTNYINVLSKTPANDTITLYIHPGWNFVSIPNTLIEGHRSIGEVFKGINTGGRSIFWYNAESQSWYQMHSQDEIQCLRGIWIYSTTSTQVPLMFYEDPTNSWTYELFPGWNAIGFTQMVPISAKDALVPVQNSWTQLIGFNAESQLYETSIVKGGSGSHMDTNLVYPGKGYWVYMNGPGTLS